MHLFSKRIDDDECSTNTCQNGAVCTNSVGSYSCDCTGTGYEGTDCDIGENDSTHYENTPIQIY